MTRTEAIDTICANLARFGEEDLTTLARVSITRLQPAAEFRLTTDACLAARRAARDPA